MTTKAAPANETAEEKAIREKNEAHAKLQEQLKKIAGKRMPRVLDAIATVSGLAIHQPTPEQQKKLVDSLKKAVSEVEEELKSSGAPKSRFLL